jgi:stage IV sporulation protein FB
MIYFGAFDVFCYYLLALWFHEFGHYIVAKRLGYMLNNLDLMPYGARLSGDTNFKNNGHKFIVTVAGPLFNIIMVLLIIAMWWMYPNTYSYTHILVEANLYIGAFNLIPLFPFDGGQALLAVIKKPYKNMAFFIMKCCGIGISILYMSLFVSSIFTIPNFTFLTVSVFIFIMSVDTSNVDISSSVKNVDCKLYGVMESKTYVVRCDVSFVKLTKYFSSNYFVIFQFVDEGYNVVNSMNQLQIIGAMESGKYFLK